MKSVLISIQPKWCELIASGKKTIEVRKTRPKLETPFKCYIYETKGFCIEQPYFNAPAIIDDDGFIKYRGRGKVIGEFVCDRIDEVQCNNGIQAYYNNRKETCLSDLDLRLYAKVGKTLYFWHISDLKIYDKPKELREFKTTKKCKHASCFEICRESCGIAENRQCDEGIITERITRPPQSWWYVEEL